jgi:oligopeptide/dipeptide ABC transporter ATP-binding protein
MNDCSIMSTPLLIARGVNVGFVDGSGVHRPAIENVSLSIFPATTFVLLGESGSGKTILSRSLTGLLNGSASITGSVLFDGIELLTAGDEVLRQIRRTAIRYVFQDPAQALNPLSRIETQLRMAGCTGNRRELSGLLASVGLPEARDILRLYPHQLSLGMAQRVMLAMAMAASPKLLVADEPTSAVDVSLRSRLLETMLRLRAERGLAMLLITHDLEVAHTCGDYVAVLYEGRIVESAPAMEFFRDPQHPYSRMLVRLGGPERQDAADSGEANVNERTATRAGCRFSHRCPSARPRCSGEEPEMEPSGNNREVRCFYWK